MSRKGFTTLEILIVVVILGIVAAIILSAFSALNKSQALKTDTTLVLTLLDQARNDTLSSKNASQYGVHFSGKTVTVFTGSTYSASASDNQVSTLSSYTTLTPMLAGGGNDIIFIRLTGETTQTGTLTLTVNGKSKVITVYGTGAAQAQ